MFLRALIVAVAATAGCGGSCTPIERCEPEFDNLPGGPLVAELVMRGANGSIQSVVEGSEIPIAAPPQGGYVMLASVRVQGVSGCAVILNAALRDPCTGRIIGLEERPIELVDRGDGWGEPADPDTLNNFANLAVCPSAALSRDLIGQPYLLEVRITDVNGANGVTLTETVTPVCSAGDSFCVCQCSFDGAACDPTTPDAPIGCPMDAGMPDADLPDASAPDASLL